jgi:hypothetical protein
VSTFIYGAWKWILHVECKMKKKSKWMEKSKLRRFDIESYQNTLN